MELRDFFAGMALCGLVSMQRSKRCCNAFLKRAQSLDVEPEDFMAMLAYDYADAMLRVREQREGSHADCGGF